MFAIGADGLAELLGGGGFVEEIVGDLEGEPDGLAVAGEGGEAAALSDIDGDGYPAWMEYLAGTDPNDPRSLFRIVDQGMADGSNYILWTSFDERGLPPFVIRRMTNLADPVWQDVGSQPRARQPVTHVWFDPASRPDAYYRLEVRDP